jgi:hypothetical protein
MSWYPFLTKMEMEDGDARLSQHNAKVFNDTKKKAKQPRSPLSLPSLQPLHNVLNIIHSPCPFSARNIDVIPISTNTNTFVFINH